MTTVELANQLSTYCADILERVAHDIDMKARDRTASSDPHGFSSGYHAGRADTLDSVARGLRQIAEHVRDDPKLALDPPELRLL